MAFKCLLQYLVLLLQEPMEPVIAVWITAGSMLYTTRGYPLATYGSGPACSQPIETEPNTDKQDKLRGSRTLKYEL